MQSAVHRVVNKLGRERFSVPFFLNPNIDSEVYYLNASTKAVIYLSTYGGSVVVRNVMCGDKPFGDK